MAANIDDDVDDDVAAYMDDDVATLNLQSIKILAHHITFQITISNHKAHFSIIIPAQISKKTIMTSSLFCTSSVNRRQSNPIDHVQVHIQRHI